MRRTGIRSVAASAAVGLLALAGCGGAGRSPTVQRTGPAGGANAAVASELPAAVKSSGLTVAVDPSYAPDEFLGSDGQLSGLDIDLVNALAAQLGLRARFVKTPFANIIAGVQSGRYSIGASSVTDTRARQQAVDLVTYLLAGEGFLVKSGGPAIHRLSDLCGKSVAVATGRVEQKQAITQSAACTAAGKPAVGVLAFPDQSAANAAFASGHAQVDFADSPVIAYEAERLGSGAVASSSALPPSPYGFVVARAGGLAGPLLDALKLLIANGTYSRIAAKWGVANGEIVNPVINGATG